MIRLYDPALKEACRDFLENCPHADYGHDPAWADVIKEAYGKDAFVYVRTDPVDGRVRGLAPACHLDSAAFGRNLVCLPYLDYGGILADDPETEDLLRDKLLAEARAHREELEIRSRRPLCGLPAPRDEKVTMILPLREDEEEHVPDWSPVADNPEEPWLSEAPDWAADAYPTESRPQRRGRTAPEHPAGDVDAYWKGLDAKVRNQVRKAEKSGVTVRWGREDRLDEFYDVFCVNMRDLGSPTHAKAFFAAVLRHFPGASIGTAHREGKCIGGLFRILWKDELVIPWASTLRDERAYCPNNLLYWEAIRYAFAQGCRLVDFGRSTRDEGTWRFKKQWQAREGSLYRYQFDDKGHFREQSWHVTQGKLGWTRNVWAKLPLAVANSLGPMLRGSISA